VVRLTGCKDATASACALLAEFVGQAPGLARNTDDTEPVPQKAGGIDGLVSALSGISIAAYLGGTMAIPFRILTVDDEPAVAFSLRHVFSGPRYEVLSVGDGYSALAKLEDSSEHYDAIIVDQKMPKLTGLELVGEIRQRHIPGKIIVLSAQLTEELRDAYKKMDVDAIFLKPFDIDELRSAVITSPPE
jgi:two-component system response regulator (stage 0 sporulation protein F)